jgi:hypothetical protein
VDAITGGKEVFIRDVAFERSVVNIGTLTSCPTPPPGNWDYSVVMGPQAYLAPDVIFSSSVFIGNTIYAHGKNLGSSVGIGLAVMVGANSTVIGASYFDQGYSGTLSDNCVVIGAGGGAFVPDNSEGCVVIGSNVYIDSNSPECILIGNNTGVPSIFARSPHSIALIFGAGFGSPSYIYHDSPNSVLLGVGTIGGYADLCFSVNGTIYDYCRASICFLGTVGDNVNTCDNTIVMGALSTSLSRASVVIGSGSSIGLSSDASVLVGTGATIGANAQQSVGLVVPGAAIGDGSDNSAIFGLSTLGTGSHNSFVGLGITGDASYFSVNVLGEIADHSGGSVCVGKLAYIGIQVADQIAIGYNSAILDYTRYSLVYGRDLLIGYNCTDVTLIGRNTLCGSFDSGLGTTAAISIGASNGIADACEGIVEVGFHLTTGPSGDQTTGNTDIYIFGSHISVGATDTSSDQVLAIGGFHTVHNGGLANTVVGFNNEVFDNVSYGVAFGDLATIGPGSTHAVAFGSEVTVSDPAGTGGDSCIGLGFAIGIGASCSDVTVIGHVVDVGQSGPVASPPNCTDVVVVGHSINVSASGTGSQRAVAIGGFHNIGYGVYSITVAGFGNTVEYGSSFVTAMGSTIRAYHGSSNNHAIGYNITLGDVETLTGRPDMVAVGSNLSIQGQSQIAIGFNLDLAGGSSDLIAIGTGSVLSGTNVISLGVGANAVSYQFVAGSTAFPYHYFSVKGSNGAGALDTLVAIDNPVSGSTGLSIVYNNGATLASKVVKAAASPPVGSLVLYMAP